VKSGASARRSKDDEHAERRAREPRKKSVAPMMVGLALIVVCLAAAGWYLGVYLPAQGEIKAAARDADDARKRTAAAEQQAQLAAKDAALTDVMLEASDAQDAAAAAAEAAAAEAETRRAEAAARKPTPSELVGAGDDIDLTALPEQAKLATTTDEDWKLISDWTATFTNMSSGAAGNRARAKLKDKGKEAFPALLNAFKPLDLATEDGYRGGDLIQKLLREICNGNNFDWRYSTAAADVLFNKKAIRLWFVSFEKARDDDAAWKKMAKIDVKPAEDAPAGDGKKPTLDDF